MHTFLQFAVIRTPSRVAASTMAADGRQPGRALHNRLRAGGAAVLLSLSALLSLAPPVARAANTTIARPVTEYEVKALYLIRFLDYVGWPESAFAGTDAPFVIGVLGRNPFGKYLSDTALVSVVQKRSVVIRYGRTAEEIGPCHLLFVAGSEADRYAEIAQHYAHQPVLLVADGPGGTKAGLALEFRLLEKTVRFAVSTGNARTRGLELRARLLSSAVEVEQEHPATSRVNTTLAASTALPP